MNAVNTETRKKLRIWKGEKRLSMAKAVYIVGILPEQQGELKERKIKTNPMTTGQVSITSQWYISRFVLRRKTFFSPEHLFCFNWEDRKKPDQQEKQPCPPWHQQNCTRKGLPEESWPLRQQPRSVCAELEPAGAAARGVPGCLHRVPASRSFSVWHDAEQATQFWNKQMELLTDREYYYFLLSLVTRANIN